MRRFVMNAATVAMLAGATIAAGASSGWAQGNPFQTVVYVNNAAVTRYEIDQRIRFMQLLRAPDGDRASVERSLIDDRLRLFAAQQMGITAAPEAIEAGLSEFAGRANMDTQQFIAELGRAGVEEQAFRDFIRAGVVWRELVGQRVAGMVEVSDAEVDQELQKIIETPEITHVALSELILPAPPGQEAAAEAQAERIVAQSTSESAFSSLARQFSAVPSAEEGGRLPWTPLANLPPSLRPIILSIQPGQVSQPLVVEGAVVLFFLRDTRGTLRPGAQEQVLDFVRFRLASVEEAARITAVSDRCEDLFVHARGLPADQIQRQTLRQGQVPTADAIRLATLDDDETAIVNMNGAVELLMLCKRTPALLADGSTPPSEDDARAIPDREAMRNQIFNRKVARAAENYLAELRANAIIRRP